MTKRRRFRFFKETKLIFGQIGLCINQPLRLNSKQIFRFKLFLKKSSRKFDKTKRYAWLQLFPHLPISRKVPGSRMGKGKGKLAGWSCELPAGLHIIEFKNLRVGRALYYLKQVQFKLPAKSSIVFRLDKSLPIPFLLRKQLKRVAFW